MNNDSCEIKMARVVVPKYSQSERSRRGLEICNDLLLISHEIFPDLVPYCGYKAGKVNFVLHMGRGKSSRRLSIPITIVSEERMQVLLFLFRSMFPGSIVKCTFTHENVFLVQVFSEERSFMVEIPEKKYDIKNILSYMKDYT